MHIIFLSYHTIYPIKSNRTYLKIDFPCKPIMPAKAGIRKSPKKLDSRLRGNDEKRSDDEETGF